LDWRERRRDEVMKMERKKREMKWVWNLDKSDYWFYWSFSRDGGRVFTFELNLTSYNSDKYTHPLSSIQTNICQFFFTWI
jgi:Cu2+-containing amine oxidase